MSVALKDICTFQSGRTPSKSNPDYFNGSIPWITTVALNGRTIGEKNAVDWITDKAIQESAAKVVPAMSIMVGTRVGVGKVAVNSIPMSTSQDIISLVGIDENQWSKDYICKFIQSKGSFLLTQARGATIKGIKIDVLADLQIPEIALEEQRKIVYTLEHLLDCIDIRQKQLYTLDQLIKARFVEMFGEPKANPYDYPLHQLSEYILYLTSGSRGWAQYCNDNGSEWFITIKNVKDCLISTANMQTIDPPDNAEAKRTRVQEGDLLISITADLGRTGVVTKEIADHGAYINQHLTCIRLDRTVLEPLYVAYFMESAAGKEQFEAKNQTGVKAGLNFNSINSLKLLVPPIVIQREFLEFVYQVDKSKLPIQASLDQLETLKQSLMQKYFG